MSAVNTLEREAPADPQRPRRGRRKPRPWRAGLSTSQGLLMLAPFIVLVATFVVYPFIRLALIATGEPNGVRNLLEFFTNPTNLRVMRTTFFVAGVVTVLAVLLGALIAWSLHTSRSKWMKAALMTAILIPFWMGSVIKLYAWTVMLQSFGVINRFMMWTGIIDSPMTLLYNKIAVVIGMTYQMLPFSVLPLAVAFSSIDLDLLRAAQSLGASRLQAIRSIVVPLALPGVLASVTLVYVISIGFYITPVVLGGITAPFAASIISQDILIFYNLSKAAVLSLFLLAGGLLIVFIGYLLVGKERLRKAMG